MVELLVTWWVPRLTVSGGVMLLEVVGWKCISFCLGVFEAEYRCLNYGSFPRCYWHEKVCFL